MAGSVVVLGGGSTGKAFVAALRRIDDDVPITLVERGLVGGECSYYACMPSKALLRPAEALSAARLAPGATDAVTGASTRRASLLASRPGHRRLGRLERGDSSTRLDVELVRGEGRVDTARYRESATGSIPTTSS